MFKNIFEKIKKVEKKITGNITPENSTILEVEEHQEFKQKVEEENKDYFNNDIAA